MAELALDVVEQILLRLDVEDLIRCKSVCKSFQSFISSPRFVKAHLNRAYKRDHDDQQLGHRRICLEVIVNEDSWLQLDCIHIVGSCNGLVCVSPTSVELVVTNPSTREHRKLPTPPFRPHMHKIAWIRQVVCWGFGYDSFTNDYKVIAGFMKNLSSKQTRFYVLSLKANSTWKVIGEVKYRIWTSRTGILCNGALHWFMTREKHKEVIISLDLSTEEFKEIPLPGVDMLYEYNCFHKLGVLEECLCIYSNASTSSTNKWVMKNNKWELYIDDHCQNKYDVAHYLPIDSKMTSGDSVEDGIRVPANGIYICASIFVESLVSPHSHNNCHCEGQRMNAKEVTENVESGHLRKRKGEEEQEVLKRKGKRYTMIYKGHIRKRKGKTHKKPLVQI